MKNKGRRSYTYIHNLPKSALLVQREQKVVNLKHDFENTFQRTKESQEIVKQRSLAFRSLLLGNGTIKHSG